MKEKTPTVTDILKNEYSAKRMWAEFSQTMHQALTTTPLFSL